MTPTPHRFDHSGMQILDDGESLKLLSSVPIGRLVFTQGGLPAVRLVNFVLHGDTLVFSTADGDKYRAAERGDVVAFEVDEVDQDRHLGWTVTAVGHLSVIESEEAESLRHVLLLRPWAPNRNTYLIRLAIESLEGRRLAPWAQRPHDQDRDGLRSGG